MYRAILLIAVVLGAFGPSNGQKMNYTPFKLLNPGVTTMSSSEDVVPKNPEQSAVLSFISENLGATIPSSGILEWLDVDADKDLDFLVVDGTIKLYENNNQVFTEVLATGLNMAVTAHVVTDLNRDNLIDIMYIENRMIKIAQNNGNKTFTIVDSGIVLDWDGAPPLYCIDVDGDTDLDIVTRPTSTFYAFIPSERFGITDAISYPSQFKFMTFENLDNQGMLDFFLWYSTDNAGYSVLSTSITTGLVYQITGTASNFNVPKNEVRWSDVDLDGDLDLFALTTSGWRFFMNNYTTTGVVQFSYSATISSSTSVSAAVGDLNSDGKPEFIVTNGATSKIDVYLNVSSFGNPLFLLDHSIPVTGSSRLYILDIDGVNAPDIVSHTKVYKNTFLQSNLSSPPLVPTQLSCRYASGKLYLSWKAHAPGLQYRYELYDGNDMIVSSESADDGTLFRLQRTPGIQSNIVILLALPEGDYSFRVQAIDASFRASAFSPLKAMDVPVGLESAAAFKVYPNPASEQVQIEVPAAGRIIIRDNLSRIVFQTEREAGTITVPVGDWSVGIYHIKFEGNRDQRVQKLVVAR